MTEKRFALTNKSLSKIGNDVAIADDGVPCTQRFVCNLLNELTEENEQLKQQLSEQGTQLDFLKDENAHMRDLVNENKQLKKDIHNIRKAQIDDINEFERLYNENEQLKGEVAHYKLILMSLEEEAKRISKIRGGI